MGGRPVIGHNAIIDIRMEGYKPSDVWLVLHDERPQFGTFTHPEQLMQTGSFPEVHVMPDEVIETLDLRFLRDLTVHIVGQSRARCRSALRRVAEFEPAKAITAGPDWLAGWIAGRGYINFLTETQSK